MHTEWLATTKANEKLSAWLRLADTKLREAEEHLQTCDYYGIPHVLDWQLWDQLQEMEKLAERTNRRAEKAETKV